MKRPGRQVIVAAVLALASTSALGCGSSERDGSTSAPLSKAAFLDKGNLICKERLQEKDEAVKAVLKGFSASEVANPSSQNLNELGESLLPPYRGMVEELDELQPPHGDGKAVSKILAQMKTGLKTAENAPENLASTDPFEEASESARSYGFTTCNL